MSNLNVQFPDTKMNKVVEYTRTKNTKNEIVYKKLIMVFHLRRPPAGRSLSLVKFDVKYVSNKNI